MTTRTSGSVRAFAHDAAIASRAAWLALAALTGASAQGQEERSNVFDDPFVQVTNALAACPVPEGPRRSA